MIKLIHNNKRAIGIVFLIVAICFMISGVGIDILHDGSSRTREAAVVNGEKFSYQDFDRQQRILAERYRSMFGENFETFARSFNLNIAQQAMDQLVDGALLSQKAKELGFAADEDAVKQYIATELFNPAQVPGGFNAEAFRGFLQSNGLTYKQFSSQTQNEITRTTLAQLISDTAITSEKEIDSRFERDETRYTVTTAEISASKLQAEIAEPSNEELQRYYEANSTEYETTAQVSYDYVVLDPKNFENEVPIRPEDVEFFYSENTARYATPEKAKIRSIQILFPKEADPAKMAAASERANKAREEATRGIPFETLVTQYSDDIPTKITGGDRGWVVRGKGTADFDKAVFNTAVGGISEVIKLDYGFEIVKVDEKQAAGTTPLDEVRASIEKELRTSEAPSFAAAKGDDLVAAAKKDGKSLKEVADSLKLTTLTTPSLLGAGSDPTPTLKGLTQQILNASAADRLSPATYDVGTLTVTAQVRDFKEPSIQPFDQVKQKIAGIIKKAAAKKLAEQRAQELLTTVKGDPAQFKKAAESRKAKLSAAFDISRAGTKEKEAADISPALRNAILKTSTPTVVDGTYPSADGYTVAVVTQIKKPSNTAAKAERAKYKQQASRDIATTSRESVLDVLKASAELDINEELLIRQ
jgi:peptidyl-prolyl cis-trans isomerase D